MEAPATRDDLTSAPGEGTRAGVEWGEARVVSVEPLKQWHRERLCGSGGCASECRTIRDVDGLKLRRVVRDAHVQERSGVAQFNRTRPHDSAESKSLHRLPILLRACSIRAPDCKQHGIARYLLSVRLHPQDGSKVLVHASRVVALAASSEQTGFFLGVSCAKEKLIGASPTE